MNEKQKEIIKFFKDHDLNLVSVYRFTYPDTNKGDIIRFWHLKHLARRKAKPILARAEDLKEQYEVRLWNLRLNK